MTYHGLCPTKHPSWRANPRWIAAAARGASISRIARHCGEVHATFERGVTAGRSPTEPPRAGPTISEILNNHLPTELRVGMWGGVPAGTLTCGCGQVLQRSDRDDVGPLQLHFLQCTLAAETSVRHRRWRAAIKRTILAAAPDLIVAEKVLAFWTHLTDGTTHTVSGDQASD